ncbi:MAG: DUF5711 family protein [Hominisplanchenecus sp.]|nr:DUF5711 family protein [Hominisplanchenecus sp.]
MKIKGKFLFKRKIQKESAALPDESRKEQDMRIETYDMTQPEQKEMPDDLWSRIKKHRHLIRNRNATAMAILFVLLFGTGAFLFFHTGSTYITVERVERNDADGTQYLEFGSYFLKYSPDGVSCVDSRSQVLWSSTFTMETPVVDVCESTAAVADQGGTQVYIFTQDGLKGQFQTLLPVEKVRVAKQGVVAVILEDEDVTWVNFYDYTGTLIAENRTTLEDFGYPVDLDLSADGMKLAVSYLRVAENKISTHIAFYNFDSAGQVELNNQVSELNCDNVIAPQIVFMDNNTAVAFRSDGFTVFSGRQAPKEKKTVQFDQEILSTFYDGSRIGFVFEADDSDHKYQMQVYNTGGKKIMQRYFDLEYDSISIQKEQIVMFNEQEFAVYKLNGQKKFQGKYRKPIENILDVRGFRKYMVLTQDSADLIRIG